MPACAQARDRPAEAVRESAFEAVAQAPHSRALLREHVEVLKACQLEAFEQALSLAAERARAAFEEHDGWLGGLRAGLHALLDFFDQEPAIARYLVVHSAQAGPAVIARRREVLARLALALDDECAPARGYPPPLTAQAVVSGVVGVLSERLSQSRPGPLVELAAPLMSFTVLPFLGVKASRRELSGSPQECSSTEPPTAPELLHPAGGRLSRRTVSVLTLIAAEPGLNSRALAHRACIKDEGQASRLLSRLERLGLVENTREPRRRANVKAWELTTAGAQLVHEIATAPPTVSPSVALDLMRASGRRLSERDVSVLRVIGAEPGLSNNDVAHRVRITDENTASQLLARLTRRGLIVNTRTRGRHNVWELTPAGEKLERAIWDETPQREQQSLALGLLRDHGGRLNHRVASVMRVIGAEPELSNNDIAERVGIEAKGHASTLLARLARFELIENLVRDPAPFEANAWQLTPSGIELAKAIRHDTGMAK